MSPVGPAGLLRSSGSHSASTSHADVVATNGATGLSGIATTLRDAPDKSPDERGRTTAGPPRCGVDAVEPRADVMAARRSARGAGVNRSRGRELSAVPRARAGAGLLVEQRA